MKTFEPSKALREFLWSAGPDRGDSPGFIPRLFTPYHNVEVERAFRRWHLRIHAKLGANHDSFGELDVAREHERQMRAAGMSEHDIQAVFFDTWGGFVYSTYHGGEFPAYPAAFIADCFTRGFSAAVQEDYSYGRIQSQSSRQGGQVRGEKPGTGPVRSGEAQGLPESEASQPADRYYGNDF